MSSPVRILAVHGDLLIREYEVTELWRYLADLGRAAGDAVELTATDTRRRFRVDLTTDPPGAIDPVPLRLRRGEVDVALIFGTLPMRHLLIGLRARRAGTRVLFFPFSLLTSDFSRGSWYLGKGTLWRRAKPLVVRVLARIWSRIAHRVVCSSAEELRQSRIPAGRALLLPWPFPDTPLAAAIDAAGPDQGDPNGPVALVSRWDPWRKGFDRLAAWLEQHADALPRPAVLLLVPPAGAGGEPLGTAGGPEADLRARLEALTEQGLIEWDDQTRGAALAGRLAGCRGAVLLSRWDGQPRVLREALLLGLPILTNRSSHLEEVLALTGAGAIVDGDDPSDVQRGFEAMGTGDAAMARALFGGDAIGRYLAEAVMALAAGSAPAEPSYYRWFPRRAA